MPVALGSDPPSLPVIRVVHPGCRAVLLTETMATDGQVAERVSCECSTESLLPVKVHLQVWVGEGIDENPLTSIWRKQYGGNKVRKVLEVEGDTGQTPEQVERDGAARDIACGAFQKGQGRP